jgi:hypothetical protein
LKYAGEQKLFALWVYDELVLWYQLGNSQEFLRERNGNVPKVEIFDGCGDAFHDVHGDPSIFCKDSLQTLDQSPDWVIQMRDREKELKSRTSKRFCAFCFESHS